jgi:hypothetical protein
MAKKFIQLWGIPIFVAIALFLVIRPTLAQFVESGETTLFSFLQSNSVVVGNESVEGYNQVYYVFQNQKKFITEGGVNSTLPHTVGEYIVYRKSEVGGDQIYLYNLLTEQTTRLTYSGNNTNPRVSKEGKVVWEGWTDDAWQIFFFDGIKIIQLTSGDMSINPEVENDYVIYTRRDIAGTYRSVVYSISRAEAKEITTGLNSKKPVISKGKIILKGEKEEEFPLTAEDFFVLGLTPLTTEESLLTVSQQDIRDELNATPSAVIETKVTPIPTKLVE